MIRYLGSVGSFVLLNSSNDYTYQFLSIFSSSAKSELLFSASINNATGNLYFNSASTSLYINGESSSVIPNKKWNHLTFSFDTSLSTYDENNFLIIFGDSSSSNFSIQNFYYMQNNLSASTVKYIHQDFTGDTSQKLTINDSHNSINIIDRPENNYVSELTGTIYHGLNKQKRFIGDIAVATSDSLTLYISSSFVSGDLRYIDGYNISDGDKVLSVFDNQLYQLNASAQFTPISSSVGDFIRVTFGQQYAENYFVNTSSGFKITPFATKVTTLLNFSE